MHRSGGEQVVLLEVSLPHVCVRVCVCVFQSQQRRCTVCGHYLFNRRPLVVTRSGRLVFSLWKWPAPVCGLGLCPTRPGIPFKLKLCDLFAGKRINSSSTSSSSSSSSSSWSAINQARPARVEWFANTWQQTSSS